MGPARVEAVIAGGRFPVGPARVEAVIAGGRFPVGPARVEAIIAGGRFPVGPARVEAVIAGGRFPVGPARVSVVARARVWLPPVLPGGLPAAVVTGRLGQFLVRLAIGHYGPPAGLALSPAS